MDKKKILVIDDDGLVRKSISKILERDGYDVSCAKSGEEARQILSTSSYDLIVCDIRMPGEDGISFLSKLRQVSKDQGKPEIPFLFITGYASEDAPIHAMKLGADDYILKPFDTDQLLAALKKVLSKTSTSSPSNSSLQDVCVKMKELVDKYHNGHEREVFENAELQKFLSALSEQLLKLEKKLIETGGVD